MRSVLVFHIKLLRNSIPEVRPLRVRSCSWKTSAIFARMKEFLNQGCDIGGFNHSTQEFPAYLYSRSKIDLVDVLCFILLDDSACNDRLAEVE